LMANIILDFVTDNKYYFTGNSSASEPAPARQRWTPVFGSVSSIQVSPRLIE
jgi:hypothetical protein